MGRCGDMGRVGGGELEIGVGASAGRANWTVGWVATDKLGAGYDFATE